MLFRVHDFDCANNVIASPVGTKQSRTEVLINEENSFIDIYLFVCSIFICR